LQHKCTAAQVRATCIPHCSVLLCKTGSQQALSQCSCTYGDLLLIQVCSAATPMHCSTGQGKMHSHCSMLHCRRGTQHALCHCSYTCGDRLFIQVCSAATLCSTGQGKIHSLLFSAAISAGVFAVTQASCEPVLQSSTKQWGMYFALNNAAVQWCCSTVHLYQEQISIGVFAVTQASCEPVLQSSTELWGIHFALTSAAVHCYWVTAHFY